MLNKTIFRFSGHVITGLLLSAQVFAATTDLATAPLVTASATSVSPNVFLMMDDSGSMNWDFMPDVIINNNDGPVFPTTSYGYASSQCNGVYYDPTITYVPPVNSDGTSFSNSSFTSAWLDGFKTSKGTVNLSTTFQIGLYQSSSAPASGAPAYYYKYLGTQTAASQKKYYNSSSTFYQECNTTASENSSPTAQITISGSNSTSVSSITVNGVSIMSGATSSSGNSGTVASSIASKINSYGNGYSATSSGSTVTIAGPNSAAGVTPVITSTRGGMTLTASAFGVFVKVVVSSTSGRNGTDERTNFANWFSYYRTRINMMKTGTGLAFKPIDNHYRVGFATMNNNTTNNNGAAMFLDLASFDSTQKSAWYTMLYNASASGGTPLLAALSQVGRMYAHKPPIIINSKTNPVNTMSGVTPADPIQYSCQQNFTILSTDGFWNNATNFDLNGNSVGDQDSALARPYTDGGTGVQTATTPTTTVVRKQTDTPQTTTTRWTRTLTTTASSAGTQGCGSGRYLVTTKTQTYTQRVTTTTTTISDTTTTTIHTVVTADGVVTSDTTSAPSTGSPVTVSTNTVTNTDTGAPDNSAPWTDSGSPQTTCSRNPTPSAGQSSSSNLSGNSSTSTGSQTVTTISTTGPTVGATTTTSSISGGNSNTLADVAMYYYNTDLRSSDLGNCTGALGSGVDVCKDNVPASGDDKAANQHMTTFTLGLGAQGRMVFSPTYKTDTSGDYYSVSTKDGVLANPAGGVCSWGTSGKVCTWPTPDPAGTPENIDDLWHAAVNGRGSYFSATNPSTLSTGLSTALSGVSARTSSQAAAATSSPIMVQGDDFIFSSTFTTQDWVGEFVRQSIDLSTATLSSAIDWSAQSRLDAVTPASRVIYTYDSTVTTPGADHKKLFTWQTLTPTEQAYFTNSNNSGNISTLSQFCANGATCLDDSSKTAAAGENLVNFLRGDRTNEGALNDTTKYYRQRSHILGDIVNAEGAYVKRSLYNYGDAGYSDFVTSNKTRQGMVYVGSNDGMLHAFNGDTGAEVWAYIPSFVLPNLYKLADKNYANLHQYYVDGTPVVGDVYFSNSNDWHTILVGGLNNGGRGYYALDITNPASPSVLWEFSDDNLGYSYGNPVITKLQDGTWVVLVASGYNNVSPGDGKGHLYVINVASGRLIRSISTGTGSADAPSGLAKINAWVDSPAINDTALRAYGGDLQGNLWRFDINGGTVQLLATLKDSSNNSQPITVIPELGNVNGNAVVYVGTGRYLGSTDFADTSQQSFYAIKDNLSNTSYGNPRNDGLFIQQIQSTVTCPSGEPASVCSPGQLVRTSTNNTVNFATDHGWYFDLPTTGERDNTNPVLALGMLLFTSNIPDSSACTIGGYSYTYFVDYRTGGALPTSGSVVARSLDNSIGSGIKIFQTPGGKLGGVTTCGDKVCKSDPPPPPPPAGNLRRVSWRELIND